MKRIVTAVAAFTAVVVGGWLALNLAFGQAKDKEKTYTMTESQLEEYVQKRVAQTQSKDGPDLDKKILQPENWHTAVYSGIEYTVYTGPGQVMMARWAKPSPIAKPAAEKPTEPKPAETKPAESKPVASKPAETKPAEAKPVAPKPAAAKP